MCNFFESYSILIQLYKLSSFFPLPGIFVITSAENVAREAKEKRQIHQTGVASQHNQDVHRQLDAIYGSASPYLVRAAAPKVQRSQPQVHYQPQQQLQEIQLDQAQVCHQIFYLEHTENLIYLSRVSNEMSKSSNYISSTYLHQIKS